MSATVEAARASTECKCKAMLADLGSSYRPKTPLPTVKDFQSAWNTLLPSVKSVPGIVLPTTNGGILVVDGLYGEQTSRAGDNFLSAGAQKLPIAASAMPVWYAQNMTAVDQMCPPQQTSSPLPKPVNLTPTPVSTVVSQATAVPSVVQVTSSPQTTTTPLPVPIPPVPIMTTPPPVQVTAQPIQVYSSQSIPVTPTPPPRVPPPPASIVAVTQKIPASTSLQVPSTLPSTKITASKPGGSNVVLIALGVGAVAMAGGVAFLLSRKKRAA